MAWNLLSILWVQEGPIKALELIRFLSQSMNSELSLHVNTRKRQSQRGLSTSARIEAVPNEVFQRFLCDDFRS